MIGGFFALRSGMIFVAPFATAALMLAASTASTVSDLDEYAALRAYISSVQPSEISESVRASAEPAPALLRDSFSRRRSLVEDVLADGVPSVVGDAPRLVLASYGDFGSFLNKPEETPQVDEQVRAAPSVNRLNKQDRTVSSNGVLTERRLDPRTGRIMKVTRLLNLPDLAPSRADEPAQTPAAKSKQNEEQVNHAAAEVAKRELQCLAKAVYFEARGETEEGQLAVAQVVMNRVKHWFYPDDVCSVVFQNEQRRNRCQFSFACDGKTDQPRNTQAWERAVTLAKKVLHGQARSKAVGDSTHYHATYVSPKWIRDMIKVRQIGTHVFYRVRAWS